jgi:hypothetical protein
MRFHCYDISWVTKPSSFFLYMSTISTKHEGKNIDEEEQVGEIIWYGKDALLVSNGITT